MNVVGTTKILGIMGFPVTYSFSPIMHNAALQHLGVDFVYVAFPVPISNLAEAVVGLKSIRSISGFNLTIPHKQEIFPYLDKISDIAHKVRAVNTVKRSGQDWIGTNTDVHGFLSPLSNLNRDWRHQSVVILGTGGAAKAVAIGCHQLGCAPIQMVGRNWEALQKLSDQMPIPLKIYTWQSLPELVVNVSLIVNATPIGMVDHPGCPLSPEQIQLLPAHAIVYDLIYTPSPTQLLHSARRQGLIVIDGLDMLLHQGAQSLEFWLEVPAPIEVMKAALCRAIGDRESS